MQNNPWLEKQSTSRGDGVFVDRRDGPTRHPRLRPAFAKRVHLGEPGELVAYFSAASFPNESTGPFPYLMS